ncbi:MAG: FtsX-like permease family protein [Chloroherpetonaceae bacterium]|nr:FtsX-like permease family protein [Chloroherpetonaceae bacterium]
MISFFRALLNSWTWKTAFRDSRTHRVRLLLFTTSIMLGSAALIAITSLRSNLTDSVQNQAKSLLGADLLIEFRQKPSEENLKTIDSLSGIAGVKHAEQTEFSAMAIDLKSGTSRLSQIRALKGAFPFYGSLETEPLGASQLIDNDRFALVDESLLLQFGISIGDSIQLGEARFKIHAVLKEIPGEAAVAALIGPRIYISSKWLNETELIQIGSRVGYKHFFQYPPEHNMKAEKEALQPKFERRTTSLATAEERQVAIGNALENLYRFLNLSGFIALLLGSIGIGSAINVYIQQKLTTVATLRCLGASAAQAFSIYLIQGSVMGLIGAAGGALIGFGIQYLLPKLLADFFPIKTAFSISLTAIFQGAMISFAVSFLFSLLPLVSLRKVSPLFSIRAAYENEGISVGRDWARWFLYVAIVLSVFLFSLYQITSPKVPPMTAVFFTIAIFAAFGVIAAFAKLVMWLLRRFFPKSLPFIFKQGLSNLYRPNNQTLILMVALGLGTFFITTLLITQGTLLKTVSLSGGNGQPNLVLFDVQTDQKDSVFSILKASNAPLFQATPVVTVRINSVKGKKLTDYPKDSIPSAYFWEFRATYRDTLTESEQLLSGAMPNEIRRDSSHQGTLPTISIVEFLAKDLKVSLGDTFIFDVQGVRIPVQVGSIRSVEFRRLQPVFSMVFQSNLLEEAPQTFAIVTRAETASESTTLQKAVVGAFPNISLLDLSVVLNVLSSILDKISLVIRFMALLSIFTGLFVLSGAVVTSRYQRMRESVLLRTLGASERQVILILLVEYFSLGFIASMIGVGLSLGGSYFLAIEFFETTLSFDFVSLLSIVFGITGLAVLIGWLQSSSAYKASPLEMLRSV